MVNEGLQRLNVEHKSQADHRSYIAAGEKIEGVRWSCCEGVDTE
jgi:hypothetical protein